LRILNTRVTGMTGKETFLTDFRIQLLRLFCLVALAHDLPEEIARLGQKGSRRPRLDSGSPLPKAVCAVQQHRRHSDCYQQDYLQQKIGTNGQGHERLSSKPLELINIFQNNNSPRTGIFGARPQS